MKIWKPVIGYEKYYEVSSDGEIRNIITGHILKPALKKNGYFSVDLRYGKPKTKMIHRIVAEAFIENANDYPCVNHIDENKTNNKADNLEWCSYKYNANFGCGSKARNSPVLQFDSNGRFIRMWQSMKDASKECGIKYQSISKVCRGVRKTCGGYKWEYVVKFDGSLN